MSQGYGPADERESIAAIRHAIDLGVTHIDTAMSYGAGHNERRVGRALAGRRDRVRWRRSSGSCATATGSMSTRARSVSQATLRPRCGSSASSTSTLTTCTAPTRGVPIEATIGAMSELVRAGKVRHLGVSELSARQLERAAA